MFTAKMTGHLLDAIATVEAAARRLRLTVERWHDSACDRAYGSW